MKGRGVSSGFKSGQPFVQKAQEMGKQERGGQMLADALQRENRGGGEETVNTHVQVTPSLSELSSKDGAMHPNPNRPDGPENRA